MKIRKICLSKCRESGLGLRLATVDLSASIAISGEDGAILRSITIRDDLSSGKGCRFGCCAVAGAGATWSPQQGRNNMRPRLRLFTGEGESVAVAEPHVSVRLGE